MRLCSRWATFIGKPSVSPAALFTLSHLGTGGLCGGVAQTRTTSVDSSTAFMVRSLNSTYV